jgi:hypothetical protein
MPIPAVSNRASWTLACSTKALSVASSLIPGTVRARVLRSPSVHTKEERQRARLTATVRRLREKKTIFGATSSAPSAHSEAEWRRAGKRGKEWMRPAYARHSADGTGP